MENARKIRRKQGLTKLLTELAEASQGFKSAEERFLEFQTLFYEKKSQLSAAELHQYGDILDTFRSSMATFQSQLKSSREVMNVWRPLFRALDRPVNDVRTFARMLLESPSQVQNTVAVRALLTRLDVLQERRGLTEEVSGTLGSMVSENFMADGPLAREKAEEQLAKFASIRRALEDQAQDQNTVLEALKRVFHRASSTPTTLPSPWAEEGQLSVMELRRASQVFQELRDAVDMMQEISGPLLVALMRALVGFKARVGFDIRLAGGFAPDVVLAQAELLG
ncbi:hypothetical protein FKP32DRAFT_1579153 [Trametes sanguinea]|nr:hypothetical protein FKP32DRAFT_1579153 [Trametes sanguinea]